MRDAREKFFTTMALLTAMVLLAVGALALAPPDPAATAAPMSQGHFEGHLQHLTQKLNLTADQQASARQLFQELKAKAAPIHQAQMQLRTQLKTALAAPNPDATAVGQLVIQMHQNRAQLKPVMDSLHQQFEALLNPDQLAQWKQMLAAHSSFRHFRGGPDWGPSE
jgi:Spy/CpxP family protein refolding chaperone